MRRSSEIDQHSAVWYILKNVFGTSEKYKGAYIEGYDELNGPVIACLLQQPWLGQMMQTVAHNLEECIPNFTSFTENLIDQHPWERDSNIIVRKMLSSRGIEEPYVEADLFSILRDLMGNCSVPSLFGRAFMDNYPDILSTIWEFDAGFRYLAMGLPRWVPIRACTKAHLARKRLLDFLTTFHRAMDQLKEGRDPEIEWCDLSDVSELIRRRHQAWSKLAVPPEGRAAGDLAILWA
jgi:hypothetical protein